MPFTRCIRPFGHHLPHFRLWSHYFSFGQLFDSTTTGEQLMAREGGVWALAASNYSLVSDSTVRIVRIWYYSTGRCTHVFGGHTSTIRYRASFQELQERNPYHKLGFVEGRRVAAGHRHDKHCDGIWDFGYDGDEDVDQANVDTVDQDLEAIPESDNAAGLWYLKRGEGNSERAGYADMKSMPSEASRGVPSTSRPTTSHHARHRVVLTREPPRRGSVVTVPTPALYNC